MEIYRKEGEPIVWLLQETWSNRADLSSAQRYGKVVPILSTSDMPSATPGPCMFKIRQALRQYRPGDFLCYALADPAAVLLTGIALVQENLVREPLQWLRWERERATDGSRKGGGFYVPSQINVG